MSARKHSPQHDFWHPKIEGQIRDCIFHHPEYFNLENCDKFFIINSLAKRIVGEIVAVTDGGHVPDNMAALDCIISDK